MRGVNISDNLRNSILVKYNYQKTPFEKNKTGEKTRLGDASICKFRIYLRNGFFYEKIENLEQNGVKTG